MKTAVMFVTVLIFASEAWAQGAPSPAPPQASRATIGSTAPVGHRQPKVSDLPADLASRQKADAQSADDRLVRDDDLDRRLKICDRC